MQDIWFVRTNIFYQKWGLRARPTIAQASSLLAVKFAKPIDVTHLCSLDQHTKLFLCNLDCWMFSGGPKQISKVWIVFCSMVVNAVCWYRLSFTMLKAVSLHSWCFDYGDIQARSGQRTLDDPGETKGQNKNKRPRKIETERFATRRWLTDQLVRFSPASCYMLALFRLLFLKHMLCQDGTSSGRPTARASAGDWTSTFIGDAAFRPFPPLRLDGVFITTVSSSVMLMLVWQHKFKFVKQVSS